VHEALNDGSPSVTSDARTFAAPRESSAPERRAERFARHPLLRVVVSRLLAGIPVLFGVSLLTFVIVNVMPGSAAQQLIGMEATPEQVARLEAQLNLDRPAWERYLHWLADALRGDLGRSIASDQPVSGLIIERLPVTLELLAYAFVLAVGCAVLLALLAARKPGGPADGLSAVLGVAGLSSANYVLAGVLVLVLAVELSWFPSIGFTPIAENVARNLRSLTLPAIAIAFPLFGLYTRFLRGDLLEQMHGEDYVTTAVAKGVGPWRVLVHHALRNSLLGLLTLVGIHIGTLISGTVVIERIFALPGIGQLLLQAISLRDVVVVQGVVLVLAVVTVLANLFVDVLYALFDPRIRYEGR
jgi:peptide/nickel transport system permease protein